MTVDVRHHTLACALLKNTHTDKRLTIGIGHHARNDMGLDIGWCRFGLEGLLLKRQIDDISRDVVLHARSGEQLVQGGCQGDVAQFNGIHPNRTERIVVEKTVL